MIKNCNIVTVSLGTHERLTCYRRRSSPQTRTSSTINLSIFSLFCVSFDPDPDPADENQWGSGTTTLLLKNMYIWHPSYSEKIRNKSMTHPGTGGCSLLTISGGNGTEGIFSSSLLSLIYLSPASSILCLSKLFSDKK